MNNKLMAATALMVGVWAVSLAALPPDTPPPAGASEPVYAGPTVPTGPPPHVYTAAVPGGEPQYLTVRDDCGPGCFTLAGRRYLAMPDGQWRTPRFYDPAAITCADGSTEGTWATWTTTDLTHFATDITGKHCGGTEVSPTTFTLTIAY